MSLLTFTDGQRDTLSSLLNSFGDGDVSRAIRQTTVYIESRYFKVTTQVDVPAEGEVEASTEFKAEEVLPDGTVLPNGIRFDSDGTNTNKIGDPIYYPNLKFNNELFSGSIELNKAYQVEEVDSGVYGEASDWYVIPKGGAGGGFVRLRMIREVDLPYNSNEVNSADVIDDEDNIIASSVAVIQRRFSSAIVYNNEILLGSPFPLESGETGYDITINMSGVGVGDWSG